MTILIPLETIAPADRDRVGGKAAALADLRRAGYYVPAAACVPVEVYQRFVDGPGIRERLALELNRKRFEDMRWEEMWDAALRIRNLFLTAPMPADLESELHRAVAAWRADGAVVVRSSAPGEDSARASFAGLHESVVNVEGSPAILQAIRTVWASLWSDRALLYRQELGLDVGRSAMAVLIQDMVAGQCSGVAFAQSPLDPDETVIEAVWGLNQGLVDGDVAPDRWRICRKTGRMLAQAAPELRQANGPVPGGTRRVALPPHRAVQPPLEPGQVREIFDTMCRLEALAGRPLDVEWTYRDGRLLILQARPITTGPGGDADDPRAWYLSLHRSYENLQALRRRIETDIVPAMDAEAARWAVQDPAAMDDAALAQAILERDGRVRHWERVYRDELIPFAHGIRLFGRFYNDRLQPADPFAFMDLLGGTGLVSVRRNAALAELAGRLRADLELAGALRADIDHPARPAFDAAVDAFLAEYAGRIGALRADLADRDSVIRLAAALAEAPAPPEPPRDDRRTDRLSEYLDRFHGDDRPFAMDLLELARASYRWRDDDNLHLGSLRLRLYEALAEGRRRAAGRGWEDADRLDVAGLRAVLEGGAPPGKPPETVGADVPPADEAEGPAVRPRQLLGQPAGPGVATGPARVVRGAEELRRFRRGEVLVCDAVAPDMTVVVPLAAAVVERRGGMLIHGAIIAREYGLPCVTGVADAARLIRTGDRLTVDGYLGIVVVQRETPP
jgi:pyruvate,water dikinase